jgi:hypothetical protein
VGKIRRGGYVFLSWKGDHPPRHVHVYHIDAAPLMQLIRQLQAEGRV